MFGFFRKKDVPPDATGRLRHIAFIMDGNGRWAKRRGLPRRAGHRYGAENFRRIAKHCKRLGIEYITIYAFSTENWKRPKEEVNSIMKLLSDFVDEAIEKCEENDMRFIFLGDKGIFDSAMREKLDDLENMSANYRYVVNIALNYGSRAEIVHAVNALADSGKKNITEADISKNLYTHISPDPDLIVRTGGDLRLSNFLLWQAAYAEFYFTKTLWPDLDESEINAIVRNFLHRDRRYGGVKDDRK